MFRRLSVIVTVALTAASLQVSSAAALTATCQGVPATIVSSAEVINGTSGRDVIVVLGSSAHVVNAGAGNDLICGSAGSDTVNAGAGRDSVFAGGGNDVVNGGAGADILKGGAGADQLFGLAGTDVLYGGVGVDALQGGTQVDSLIVGTGANFCAKDPADRVSGTCTVDAAAPRLAVQATELTVTAGSTVTFTWSVEDASGISRTGLKIGGPSGWVTTWCGFALEGSLVSGTAQNGTYEVSCDVPVDAVNQQYTAFVDATDVFGSWIELTQIPLTVVGGTEDRFPPAVENIEVLPAVVSPGQDFIVRYRVSDPSGVRGAIVWLALNGYGFADNSGRGYAEMPSAPVLVAGDAFDGVYELTVRMSSFAPAGEYTVWSSAIDEPGNKAFEQTQVTFTVTA